MFTKITADVSNKATLDKVLFEDNENQICTSNKVHLASF